VDAPEPLTRSDPPTELVRPQRQVRGGGFDQVSDAAYDEILAVLLDEAERHVPDDLQDVPSEGAA
jgi:hypothetical protein